MNNFIQIMKLVVMLLPMIVEIVRAVETAMPEKGQGAAKLEAVRVMVESVYKVASDSMPAFEQVWAAAQGIVAATVSLYNATGVFKK